MAPPVIINNEGKKVIVSPRVRTFAQDIMAHLRTAYNNFVEIERDVATAEKIGEIEINVNTIPSDYKDLVEKEIKRLSALKEVTSPVVKFIKELMGLESSIFEKQLTEDFYKTSLKKKIKEDKRLEHDFVKKVKELENVLDKEVKAKKELESIPQLAKSISQKRNVEYHAITQSSTVVDELLAIKKLLEQERKEI